MLTINLIHRQPKALIVIQVFLGILILSGINCTGETKDKNIEYGRESRLISTLILMNCYVDNLAIYNEYYAYRLRKEEYELIGFSDDVGSSEKVFSVVLKNYVDELSQMKNAKISISRDGKKYIGLPILEGVSSYPPESHFCFRYDSLNTLKIDEQGRLNLGSVRYMTQKEYDKLMSPRN